MTTALIDLEPLIYRAAFAAQRTIRLVYVDGMLRASFTTAKARKNWLKTVGLTMDDIVEDTAIEAEKEHVAYHYAEDMLNHIRDDLEPESMEFYVTDKEHEEENFRYKIYPEYKANRRDLDKPVHYDAVANYFNLTYKVSGVAGMEPDDALTIRANQLRDFFIVTIDKDLDTAGGWHYNPVTRKKYMVTPDAAEQYFYNQILTGDRADNIIGLHKVGPVKADKILSGCTNAEEMWDKVVSAYKDQGRPVEDAIQNAKLLYMLRKEDEVWQPPT